MLYLIESPSFWPEEESFLKVGYTKNKSTWEKRLAAYNTHNPCFSILGVIEDGSKDFETGIHRYLLRNSWRSDMVNLDRLEFEGEWLDYDQRFVDMFKKLQGVDELVSSVESEFLSDISLLNISKVDLFETAVRFIYNFFDDTKENTINNLEEKESRTRSLIDIYYHHLSINTSMDQLNLLVSVLKSNSENDFYFDYNRSRFLTIDREFIPRFITPLKEIESRLLDLLFP